MARQTDRLSGDAKLIYWIHPQWTDTNQQTYCLTPLPSRTSIVIELWSCCCLSIVLHLRRDILSLDGGRCCCCHMCFFHCMNTIEFFHPKNKQILKKSVYTGWNFIRKYSYLKTKCIIISKLLLLVMQEPTIVMYSYLLFMAIFRCPSLVVILKLDPGDVMSVLQVQ